MQITLNSESNIPPNPRTSLTSIKEIEKDEKIEKKIKMDAPYGWIIVLVSFIMQFVGDGICFTFGIFYAEISREFPEVGKSGVAWIASILISTFHAIGPIGSILMNKFGPRIVSILGSGFAAIGFASSYYSRNVETMYFTIGILGGKLAFAMGVCVSGSGTGTLFFEWALGQTLEIFPWRIALLMIGGVIILTLPLGIIYPGRVNQNTSSHEDLESKPDKKALDLSLLTNVLFLLFASSGLMAAVGFNTPYIYLPEIEQKLSNSSSSTLLSFIGGANVLSRIILGYFGDKSFINRRYLCIAALAAAGIATCLCPYLTSITWLRAYGALYGTCMGTYISLRSVILVDFLGLDSLADAFGILLLVEAIGIFIGTPTVGFLYDHFGNYDYGFYFAGLSIFISALLLFLIPMAKKIVDRKKLVKNEDKDEGTDNQGFQ